VSRWIVQLQQKSAGNLLASRRGFEMALRTGRTRQRSHCNETIPMLCGLGLIAGALFLLSMPCHAKDEPIKLSTITNASEPSSVEVLRLFRQRIESHENLFKLVENSDPSLGLLFTEDCMPRQASEPYARSGCVKALFWASCRPRIYRFE
jgi:hypothetical protein